MVKNKQFFVPWAVLIKSKFSKLSRASIVPCDCVTKLSAASSLRFAMCRLQKSSVWNTSLDPTNKPDVSCVLAQVSQNVYSSAQTLNINSWFLVKSGRFTSYELLLHIRLHFVWVFLYWCLCLASLPDRIRSFNNANFFSRHRFFHNISFTKPHSSTIIVFPIALYGLFPVDFFPWAQSKLTIRQTPYKSMYSKIMRSRPVKNSKDLV